MTYTPLLIAHICGGVIGVLSGFVALIARKGGRLHRQSGDVFVVAMLIMAASGACLGFLRSQPGNVVAGSFTFYLVGTAWLTVMRKEKETGRTEIGLLLVGLAVGAISLIFGWKALHRATGGAAAPDFVFGLVVMLAVAGDIRMLIRGGVSGAQRLARHLWRMCVGLFIATASFFLGTARTTGLRARIFTAAIRKTHLPEVPVLIVAILTIFWLCRVRFSSAYRRPKPVM